MCACACVCLCLKSCSNTSSHQLCAPVALSRLLLQTEPVGGVARFVTAGKEHEDATVLFSGLPTVSVPVCLCVSVSVSVSVSVCLFVSVDLSQPLDLCERAVDLGHAHLQAMHSTRPF